MERIIAEAKTLVEGAAELLPGGGDTSNWAGLAIRYEAWYTKALAVVSTVTPDRRQDFVDAYRLAKRKDITYETYTISDFLMGLRVTRLGQDAFDHDAAYSSKVVRQIGILRAAGVAAASVLLNIRSTLQAELIDADIVGAKELASSGHVRSAGVMCGVVLEEHLKTVAARHNVALKGQKAMIGNLNDGLRAGGVYDLPMWRLVQRLGDLRNLCAHSGEREPTRDDLDDLIAGTEKVVKEVS